MAIQLNSIIVRNDSILFSDLDDEMIMMNIDKGEYYNLDAIGARIWTLLKKPARVAELCETLTDEFKVDLKTCRQDVLDFINRMFALDVITVLKEKQ